MSRKKRMAAVFGFYVKSTRTDVLRHKHCFLTVKVKKSPSTLVYKATGKINTLYCLTFNYFQSGNSCSQRYIICCFKQITVCLIWKLVFHIAQENFIIVVIHFRKSDYYITSIVLWWNFFLICGLCTLRQLLLFYAWMALDNCFLDMLRAILFCIALTCLLIQFGRNSFFVCC